jgi:wyosine [tRNA(Phe)-imidazoG37] synthetase (radical SAM superfamily)
VYCECGKTTRLTVKRDAYTPAEEVIAELDAFLDKRPALDHVTFSGAGEPTLNRDLGRIAVHVKTAHPGYRVALLTNSTLLSDPETRKQAMEAHVVCASLDAVDETVFRAVNRPHPRLSARAVVEGLLAFREEYAGELAIEVFLVPGLNDTPGETARLAEALRAIRPSRVQLNTLDRPGTEPRVTPVSRKRLLEIAEELGGVEILGPAAVRAVRAEEADAGEQVLNMLRRRPMTAEDVARVLGVSETEAQGKLDALGRVNRIVTARQPRGVFYRAVDPDPKGPRPR